jgi:gliding motility-associated-like protein
VKLCIPAKIFLLLVWYLGIGKLAAQNLCDKWLLNVNNGAGVLIGDLDVPGNKITVEARFNRLTPWSPSYLFAGDIVSKHKDPLDCNYLLRPMHCEIATSSGFFATVPACDIELNKTYHVAMVYDGSFLRFYQNGFLMDEVPATGDLVLNNWITRIGDVGGPPFTLPTNLNGFINEVRIWNVARSQQQIRDNIDMPLPNPTTQSGLLAYYNFDNLINKQGNPLWNGTLLGNAKINQTNTNCNFKADSCGKSPPSCAFDFTFKQDPCNPLLVELNTNTDYLGSLHWKFGDGSPVIIEQNPTHQFPNEGNFLVEVWGESAFCPVVDTVRKQLSFFIGKDHVITTPDTTICNGASVQLFAVPGSSYCWSPSIYLSNPNIANPVAAPVGNITYTLLTQTIGSNLVTNGNFNNGFTGFSSGYNFATLNTSEGEVYVGSNTTSWNGAFSNCADHTSGSGNMLLVNGSPSKDIEVWKQTISVSPNTNYEFSVWLQALYNVNPAQLQFAINGVQLGNIFNATLPTCTWSKFNAMWNAGANTTAEISIVNKNTAVQGNDFALDDISFAPITFKTDSIKIGIDKPMIQASADTSVCNGSAVALSVSGGIAYKWSPAINLSDATSSNPVATVKSPIQYVVTGTNNAGCAASDSVVLGLLPAPVIVTSNDATICMADSTSLLATGGVTYTWSPAIGLSNNLVSNPVASPPNTTTYKVLVTGANTCTQTDSVLVVVRPKPVFDIDPDSVTVCAGTPTVLQASGGDGYLWQPSAGLNSVNNAAVVATVYQNQTYAVRITDSFCRDTAYLTSVIKVQPPANVMITKSNDITCDLPTTQLSASGGVSYVWEPAVGLSNALVPNPVASPLVTTTYRVMVKDYFGCEYADSVIVQVQANGAGALYQMPSAFTPNGDGLNDCFGIKKWGNVRIQYFDIYNRWGQLVFKGVDGNNCWDGRWQSIPQPSGNYVYKIKVQTICGIVERTGSMMLIR